MLAHSGDVYMYISHTFVWGLSLSNKIFMISLLSILFGFCKVEIIIGQNCHIGHCAWCATILLYSAYHFELF